MLGVREHSLEVEKELKVKKGRVSKWESVGQPKAHMQRNKRERHEERTTLSGVNQDLWAQEKLQR